MTTEILFQTLLAVIGTLALLVFNRLSKDIQRLSDSADKLNERIGDIVIDNVEMKTKLNLHDKMIDRHEDQFKRLGVPQH